MKKKGRFFSFYQITFSQEELQANFSEQFNVMENTKMVLQLKLRINLLFLRIESLLKGESLK